jgi:catechol 2,3-dioxygenase-like lactoylglutathione lyase family enzyme
MSFKISGINHLAFACENLEKSTHLFKYIFGAEEVKATSDEIFLKLADFWIVIIKGKPLEKSYNHYAFQVDSNDLSDFEEKIKFLKLDILPGRDRAVGKNNSLYFYDYDNHLFELHTGDLQITLNEKTT